MWDAKVQARRLQGRRAKANGELFETLFQRRCQLSGIAVTRVPDGCKQISQARIIRVKTPFDWIITYRGETALIDTKTSQNHSFPHYQIDEHQVSELMDQQVAGCLGGYVIWLRGVDQILFIPVKSLFTFRETRGSIEANHPDAIRLGNSMDWDPRMIFKDKDNHERSHYRDIPKGD